MSGDWPLSPLILQNVLKLSLLNFWCPSQNSWFQAVPEYLLKAAEAGTAVQRRHCKHPVRCDLGSPGAFKGPVGREWHGVRQTEIAMRMARLAGAFVVFFSIIHINIVFHEGAVAFEQYLLAGSGRPEAHAHSMPA